VDGAESGHMRSIEVLQLALLGIALLLVAARLRVLALRRRAARSAPHRPAVRADVPARRPEPDEWPFPDPSAPAPRGLLPSTASARRRARELGMPCGRG
jgi:hypothetical protein